MWVFIRRANLELLSIYTKFGQNKILTLIKGCNSVTNLLKMMCNNSNLDFVNIDVHTCTKPGQILSIPSQENEWK